MTDILKKFQSKLHCVADELLLVPGMCVCIAHSLSSLQILSVVFITECDIRCVISVGDLSQLSQHFSLSTWCSFSS